MFELILRAPRTKQVLVYSRFNISQNLLYSPKNFHIVFFWGVLHNLRKCKWQIWRKIRKIEVFIQNSYWEQNTLFSSISLLAPLAQLVEHLASIQEIVDSSPSWSKNVYYHGPTPIMTFIIVESIFIIGALHNRTWKFLHSCEVSKSSKE